jgi:hypothetical protein
MIGYVEHAISDRATFGHAIRYLTGRQYPKIAEQERGTLGPRMLPRPYPNGTAEALSILLAEMVGLAITKEFRHRCVTGRASCYATSPMSPTR